MIRCIYQIFLKSELLPTNLSSDYFLHILKSVLGYCAISNSKQSKPKPFYINDIMLAALQAITF